jgi:hypothetical protein
MPVPWHAMPISPCCIYTSVHRSLICKIAPAMACGRRLASTRVHGMHVPVYWLLCHPPSVFFREEIWCSIDWITFRVGVGAHRFEASPNDFVGFLFSYVPSFLILKTMEYLLVDFICTVFDREHYTLLPKLHDEGEKILNKVFVCVTCHCRQNKVN